MSHCPLELDLAAEQWADKLSVATPIATRAIAPTGTISIVGGHTTPGIEPIFHTAYLRTYNTLKEQHNSNGYKQEYVIDPVVQKLLDEGHNVEDIDTAYTLSLSTDGIEKRIAFQAYVQQFVDNAISSTVNLPQYIPDSYKRFLENRLRKEFDFKGVPIKIFFRKK